jgi:hypothetical protein
MRTVALVLVLATLSMAGCGPRAPSVDDRMGDAVAWGRLPTSPGGVDGQAQASLPARALHRAREFRGNPLPLGVLTGGVLIAALVLGLYTVRLAYRTPPEDRTP